MKVVVERWDDSDYNEKPGRMILEGEFHQDFDLLDAIHRWCVEKESRKLRKIATEEYPL